MVLQEHIRHHALHWTIGDERIGGFRSDAFAVQTPDGLMVIDAVGLDDHLQAELDDVGGLFLTHGSHQRSAWRLRKELGAKVYAPASASGLDEEPDAWFDETTALPTGCEKQPTGCENQLKGRQKDAYRTRGILGPSPETQLV